MENLKIAEKIGKKVKVKTTSGSYYGEILTADNRTLVLATPIDLTSKDNAPVLAIDETLCIIHSDEDEILSIEDVEYPEYDIKTIGNFIRYSQELNAGTYYKSTDKEKQDWGKAAEHYRKALVDGYFSDDVLALYFKTLYGHITFIVSNKGDKSPEEIYKDLDNKLIALEKFRSFIEETPSKAYDMVSEYCLINLNKQVFLTKCSRYASNIITHVYNRLGIEVEKLNVYIDQLIEFPETTADLLLFTIQSDILRCILSKHGEMSTSHCKYYYSLGKFLSDCKKYYETEKETTKEEGRKARITHILEKTLEIERNIDEKNIESKLNEFSDPKSRLFSIIFNVTQNELTKSMKTDSAPDRMSAKKFYDKCMTRCYTLLKSIDWFQKGESMKESKWHIALNLMELYSKKLELVSEKEKTETFHHYQNDIVNDILSFFPNRYSDCPGTKLAPISGHLFDFELWEEYEEIAQELLNDAVRKVKTPNSQKYLCSLRMAKIKTDLGKNEEAIEYFEKAKNLHILLSENLKKPLKEEDKRKIREAIEEGDEYYKRLSQDLNKISPIIELKVSLKEIQAETEVNRLNEDIKKEQMKRLVELINKFEGWVGGSSIDGIGSVYETEIRKLLEEILPYLDDKNLSITKRIIDIREKKTNSRVFNLDPEEIKSDRYSISSLINTEITNIRNGFLYAWKMAIDSFNENRSTLKKNRNNYSDDIIKINDNLQKGFFAYLDKLKSLSEKDILDTLRLSFPPRFDNKGSISVKIKEVDDKNKEHITSYEVWGTSVKNFIHYHLPLLWEKAEGLQIHCNKDFHNLVLFYCEYNNREIDTNYAKSRYRIARDSKEYLSIGKRIEYCNEGLSRINKTYYDKDSGTEIESRDYKAIKALKEELEKEKSRNESETNLAALRKKHYPKHTAILWNKVRFTDLKYLIHGYDRKKDITMLELNMVEELDKVVTEIKNFNPPISLLKQLYGFIGKPLPDTSVTPVWTTILNEPKTNAKSGKQPFNKTLEDQDDLRDTIRFKPENKEDGVPRIINKYLADYFAKFSDDADSGKIQNLIQNIEFVTKKSESQIDFYGNPQALLDTLLRTINSVKLDSPRKFKITVESKPRPKFGNKDKNHEILIFETEEFKVEFTVKWNRISITELGRSIEGPLDIEKISNGGGDIFEIAKLCRGYCDYKVKVPTIIEEGGLKKTVPYTYDILNSNDHESGVIIRTEATDTLEGFTHELTYYTLNEKVKEKKRQINHRSK